MSFATTAKNIELHKQGDGYYLSADLATGHGDNDWNRADFRLDDKIGNDHGILQFGTTNFSTYSQNVNLLDNGRTLIAELATGGDPGWRTSTIDLNRILANNYGQFAWSS
jgi:hypothetical protein